MKTNNHSLLGDIFDLLKTLILYLLTIYTPTNTLPYAVAVVASTLLSQMIQFSYR